MQTYQLVIAYSFIGVAAFAGLGAWYKQSTRVGAGAATIAVVGLVLVTAMAHVDPEEDDGVALGSIMTQTTMINKINNEQFTEMLARRAITIDISSTSQALRSPTAEYNSSIFDTSRPGSPGKPVNIYCGNVPVFRMNNMRDNDGSYYLFLAHYNGAKNWLIVSNNYASDSDFANQKADQICNAHDVLKKDKTASTPTPDGVDEYLPEAYMLQDIEYHWRTGGLVGDYTYQWRQLQQDRSSYEDAITTMTLGTVETRIGYGFENEDILTINLPIDGSSN